MSVITKYDFSLASQFVYNSNEFEILNNKGQLKNRKPDNFVFYASFNNDLNANWGNGTLTGTPFGGVSITTGTKKFGNASLDVSADSVAYVDYDGDNIQSLREIFTIEYWYAANYSGAPASKRTFFAIFKDVTGYPNLVKLEHDTDGHLKLTIKDYMGVFLYNAEDLGNFPAASGTFYHFSLNVDVYNGTTRLFVNGSLFGGILTGICVRDNTSDTIRIGGNEQGTTLSKGYIDEFYIIDRYYRGAVPFLIPSEEQIQTMYKLGDTIIETVEGVRAKEFRDISLTTVQKAVLDEINAIMVVDGVDKWWDATLPTPAWIDSDGTYLESNTLADIVTNALALISSRAILKVKLILHSNDGLTQIKIDDLELTYDYQYSDIANVDHIPIFTEVDDYIGELSDITLKMIPDRVNVVEQMTNGISYMPKTQESTSDIDGYCQVDIPRSNDFVVQMKYTAKIIDAVTEKLLAEYKNLIVPDTALPDVGISLATLVQNSLVE